MTSKDTSFCEELLAMEEKKKKKHKKTEAAHKGRLVHDSL